METFRCIKIRRSIRKFISKEISKENLYKILEAGMYAPSAKNCQCFEFLVVRNKEKLEEISKFHPYAKMAKDANKAIIILANLKKENVEGYFIQDCSAATQNILLASTDLNIGSVWCGIYNNDLVVQNFKDLFDLPKYIIPFSLVLLGYSDISFKDANRFDEEKIHFNNF
jgi:nitroreductase